MANTIVAGWRNFWHTMTSPDRHAGPDSRYGQRIAVAQSKRNSLVSTNTSALESRSELDLEAGNGFVRHHTAGNSSPPYSPSTRRSLQKQPLSTDSKMDGIGSGEIQMQSFADGLPPPPPVSHSWKRIDRWLEDNYEELFENLCYGATVNDVNELEAEVDCTLPQEVRESLQIHDGQERGGQPTGVIFGCMLLDCEEIYHEWQNWRTVNEAYLTETPRFEIPQTPLKAFAGSSSSTIPVAQIRTSANPQWRAELLEKQDSQPPNAVQKVYTHPAWIPLARDWGGNNIAVDLAPGPTGRWGQIILIGRDYDCKYVVSRSWSAFLATLADDMHTDKWFIDEDSKELKLREFKQQGVEPAYIDILRWRSDQKYGRRMSKKRTLRINSDVSQGQPELSPYASPTVEDRGRSPHRLSNGKAPAHQTASPRTHIGSPLACVTEETSPTNPLRVMTDVQPVQATLISGIDSPRSTKVDKAAPTESFRRPSDELLYDQRASSSSLPRSRLGSHVMSSGDEEEAEEEELSPLSPVKNEGIASLEGEMKDVRI